uniref:Uncharacterized protein n=1 Tax=Brassica oleracea var. oleracea TaxID=109376 RepID=A0A0D3E683_BRAOL
MWSIKKEDLVMKERLSKMKLLESLVAKQVLLADYEEALKKKLIDELMSNVHVLIMLCLVHVALFSCFIVSIYWLCLGHVCIIYEEDLPYFSGYVLMLHCSHVALFSCSLVMSRLRVKESRAKKVLQQLGVLCHALVQREIITRLVIISVLSCGNQSVTGLGL